MGRVASILIAGVGSGLAYLGAQSVDLALTGNNLDDRVLLGRLTPVSPQHAQRVGALLHLANSIIFAAAFRLLARDILKGPMWLRGVIFANIENALLFPLAIFEDFHPAIRDGQLGSYQNWTAFFQQLWRHNVLGAVVGLLTPKRD